MASSNSRSGPAHEPKLQLLAGPFYAIVPFSNHLYIFFTCMTTEAIQSLENMAMPCADSFAWNSEASTKMPQAPQF